jgi:hypothetical protein
MEDHMANRKPEPTESFRLYAGLPDGSAPFGKTYRSLDDARTAAVNLATAQNRIADLVRQLRGAGQDHAADAVPAAATAGTLTINVHNVGTDLDEELREFGSGRRVEL